MAGFSGGPKTGAKCKLYYNTGNNASPVWVLVDEIGDVSLTDFTKNTADLKRRASGHIKKLGSLFSAPTIEFRLHHGLSVVVFERIRDDFLAETVRQWAIANAAIATNGTQGLKFFGLTTEFPWDQPLEDVTGHDVKVVSTYAEESSTEVDPEWFEIGGST
jgi:hypothetical protein